MRNNQYYGDQFVNKYNNDEISRLQRQQIFAQQQREDYENYMKKKQDYIQNMYYDKNVLSSPIKITEDNNRIGFNLNNNNNFYKENPYSKYQQNQNYNSNRNILKNNNIMNYDSKIQNIYNQTPKINMDNKIKNNNNIYEISQEYLNEISEKNKLKEYKTINKNFPNQNNKYYINKYEMTSIGENPAPKLFPELYAPNENILDKYAKEMEEKRKKRENAFEEMQLPLLQSGKYLLPLIKPIPKSNLKPGELPFDRRLEERQEYLENKIKNNSTYTNLTHIMSNDLSLKTIPLRPINESDKEKIYQMQLKEEKMRKYKESLDNQIRNKTSNTYSKENNDYKKEIPPNPYSRGYLNSNSNILNNPIN